MNSLSAQRKLSSLELQSVLRGEDTTDSEKIAKLVESMATTREQIVSYDEEIASLTARKRVIKEGPGHSDAKIKSQAGEGADEGAQRHGKYTSWCS